MRRGPSRHRLGLIAVFAGLTLLFVWDNVQGQGPRQRVPGMPGMPGPNIPNIPDIPGPPFGGGGMGGGFEFVYTCTNCRKEVGRGRTGLDGPASCPFCGVRFINGGFGGGGGPAMPPFGDIPGFPPSNFRPAQPAPVMPPQQPAALAQPFMAPQAPISGDASNSTTVAAPSGSKWLIPGIIAMVVLGLLGVGGVWMMLASMNKDEPALRRSRKRRRRDDDDYSA